MNEQDEVVEPTVERTEAPEPQIAGAFVGSLTRNNKQIRDDRARSIAEDTQMIYRRRVEDLRLELSKAKRELEGMLDLSPNNTFALVPAVNDYDAGQFVERDLELGLRIRNIQIKLQVAEAHYTHLFGGM